MGEHLFPELDQEAPPVNRVLEAVAKDLQEVFDSLDLCVASVRTKPLTAQRAGIRIHELSAARNAIGNVIEKLERHSLEAE